MKKYTSPVTPGLPPYVKLTLLGTAVLYITTSAGLFLMPDRTAAIIGWDIGPQIGGQMLAVIFGAAAGLAGLGLLQQHWSRSRIVLAPLSFFAFANATLLVLNLTVFTKTYSSFSLIWLAASLALGLAVPLAFWRVEREKGGALPVGRTMKPVARITATATAFICGLAGLGLLAGPAYVSSYWPWNMDTLEGRLAGVWFIALAVGYLWSLSDGDWRRSQPLFWLTPVAGLLMLLVPLLNSPQMSGPLLSYTLLAGLTIVLNLTAVVTGQERLEYRETRISRV